MPWTSTVFEIIDMHSFSNLWFWIGLAVMWSLSSHYVLGVPFDMLIRARRNGEAAQQDVMDLARININRLDVAHGPAGPVLFGVICFILTGLGLLGFYYWIEFCQALFLLLLPQSIVALLSVRAGAKIRDDNPDFEGLAKHLMRHRVFVQIVGMTSIFITAMWGMWVNLTMSIGW